MPQLAKALDELIKEQRKKNARYHNAFILKVKECVATVAQLRQSCACHSANLTAERIDTHGYASGKPRITREAFRRHQRNLGEVALRSSRGLIPAQALQKNKAYALLAMIGVLGDLQGAC
ncbi:MAG: hypothetical protein HOP19_01185 [Acidobacteria bacterium]|nr:hypothetical protein [Acidobacteriota bacterium]